jgi:beta-glucanase (GH16 family)
MDGGATGPNGNVGAKKVSQEPMSMVFNLGISGAWVEIFMADLVFPTVMHNNYAGFIRSRDMRTLLVICLVIRRRSISKITLWRIIIRI